MKELITHAMSYYLGRHVDEAEASRLMKTMGLRYIKTEEIPESDEATITLITTKKLLSSVIDYYPIHRSSHIVRPPDFDTLLETLQSSGRLKIGGVPGVGKTTLAYLLLSRLPKPYWLLRLKADTEVPVELINRLVLMTDTPLLVFCDRDIDTCGRIPRTLPHLILGEGKRLGPHSPKAAAFVASEILKRHIEPPPAPRMWIEIALMIRNLKEHPEESQLVWKEGLEAFVRRAVEAIPEVGRQMLGLMIKEGHLVSPKAFLKVSGYRGKQDFIEYLVSTGIVRRKPDGTFTISHPAINRMLARLIKDYLV